MSEDSGKGPPKKLLQAFDFAAEMALKETAHQDELRALLVALLGIADSFDRFLTAAEQVDEPRTEDATAWRSAGLINKQFLAVLREAGVEPIECLEQIVDCEQHEIVETRSVSGAEEGTILDELVRGYRWHGQVIRRPQVTVAAFSKE